MKIVLTGSIGNVNKPLAQQLVAAGHQVTIISSNPSNTEAISELGATAAIGSVEDASFIQQSFAGADAVYLMIPPKFTVTNWKGYQQEVSDIYANAIASNQVPHVVVLSSVGAHMGTGAGPVDGLAYLESALNKATGFTAVYLRPSYFYYNLFSQIGLVQHANIFGSAQPADFTLVLSHTTDIADAAVAALTQPAEGKTIQYIASDVATWQEIATELGNAIGKPGTPYIEFTDEQSYGGMKGAGLSDVLANGYVTMNQALRSGEMQKHFFDNEPAQYGKVKLADFAKEFAAVYNAKN
ncbi:MAG: NAD-dependent dehydratase [Bacteroidetes bacterium]|nr:MAG: NAD-dependent dehydratase [Bacteroidota bacterium]TAE68838.1 MAG: NAD-dependent dehydratase [Bacteroidota bacterium]